MVTGSAAIPLLLDDGLLSGQHEVQTVLRPERHARPVNANDLTAALAEIEWACQMWGGGSQPLLPVVNGSLRECYGRVLAVEEIDFVVGRQEHDLVLPKRVRAQRRWEVPAALVYASADTQTWRPVEVVELADNDPWRPIYFAVLGSWPVTPPNEIIEHYQLRDDLSFDQLVPVERVKVAGSLNDLVDRASSRERLSPRVAANMFLSYGSMPDTSFLGRDRPVLPNPHATRRAAGPNIIVAVSPGSVEDMVLLWNLRGAHRSGRALPIGLPIDQITPDGLRFLGEPGRATMFGLAGGACHMVSASLTVDSLQELGREAPSVQVVPYESVLTFGPAPGRVHNHVCQWRDGTTRLDPMTDSDREVVSVLGAHRPLSLTLDVRVNGELIPTDPTMRGAEHFGRFQAGSAQIHVSNLRDEATVRVRWPSLWTSLAAVAGTRGLKVVPSEAGRAATTLIRALGDIDEIRLLHHRPLIALMYKMAERSGMSWWKRRWRTTHAALLEAGADSDALDSVEARLGRDDPVVAPSGEGRAVPFSEFKRALRTDAAARNWIAWAERRHLVVRGANVTCPDCRTETWLPLAALPPPVPCPGCGRPILHPYNPGELKFMYRLGEPLRRVLESDSLGHVLAVHWFTQLFRRSGLVGAHPGVSFTLATDDSHTLGEADVLLMFADGTLVPAEVKRRYSGVDERTIGLMNTLTDALHAPWDALVVTEPARDIPLLVDHERRLPDRPRLVLTEDQLHDHHVVWAMGVDPFEWDPRTVESDTEREQEFVRRLSTDPDSPIDQVAEVLLSAFDDQETPPTLGDSDVDDPK